MDFVNTSPAKRTAGGLSRAITVIGCDSAALQSVLQVETGGAGYDHNNRPKALFEPHLFYATLTTNPAKQATAVAQGLAYPKWGTKPYPADSYPHIAMACAIDQELALRSTSWGLPQVLGSNFKVCGYTSAVAMVQAFISGGEDEQLFAMAKFIVGKNLAKPLASHEWATFAKGYNGSGYAKNHYDTKLAQAYTTFKAKPVSIIAPATEAATLNSQIASKQASAKTAATVGGSIAAVAAVASPVVANTGTISFTTGFEIALTLVAVAGILAVITIRFAQSAKIFATTGT